MRNMGRNGEGGVPSSAVHNAAAAIPSAVVATCSAMCRKARLAVTASELAPSERTHISRATFLRRQNWGSLYRT